MKRKGAEHVQPDSGSLSVSNRPESCSFITTILGFPDNQKAPAAGPGFVARGF